MIKKYGFCIYQMVKFTKLQRGQPNCQCSHICSTRVYDSHALRI